MTEMNESKRDISNMPYPQWTVRKFRHPVINVQ